MEGRHYDRQSGTTRGVMRTLVQAGAPPCDRGAWDSPPCFRGLLSLAEQLAAPTDGVPSLQFYYLFSSNLFFLQKSMINFKYKFCHHSSALLMIHCLSYRVKPQFLSVAWKALHDPTFQPVVAAPHSLTFQLFLTTCLFLHLFYSPCFVPLCMLPFHPECHSLHLTGFTLFPV